MLTHMPAQPQHRHSGALATLLSISAHPMPLRCVAAAPGPTVPLAHLRSVEIHAGHARVRGILDCASANADHGLLGRPHRHSIERQTEVRVSQPGGGRRDQGPSLSEHRRNPEPCRRVRDGTLGAGGSGVPRRHGGRAQDLPSRRRAPGAAARGQVPPHARPPARARGKPLQRLVLADRHPRRGQGAATR